MVGRLLAALALAATSLVVLGTTGTPAYACSCVSPDLRAHVEGADAVFTGSVVETVEPGRLTGAVLYEVEVDAVHKGDVPAVVTLSTSAQGTACGLPGLPEGERLLFFGIAPEGFPDDPHSDGRADYAVNSCNGTGETDERELSRVAALAGEPREPGDGLGSGGRPVGSDIAGGSEDEEAEAQGAWTPWLVGAGGVGALVLAFAVGVLLRRKLA